MILKLTSILFEIFYEKGRVRQDHETSISAFTWFKSAGAKCLFLEFLGGTRHCVST